MKLTIYEHLKYLAELNRINLAAATHVLQKTQNVGPNDKAWHQLERHEIEILLDSMSSIHTCLDEIYPVMDDDKTLQEPDPVRKAIKSIVYPIIRESHGLMYEIAPNDWLDVVVAYADAYYMAYAGKTRPRNTPRD